MISLRGRQYSNLPSHFHMVTLGQFFRAESRSDTDLGSGSTFFFCLYSLASRNPCSYAHLLLYTTMVSLSVWRVRRSEGKRVFSTDHTLSDPIFIHGHLGNRPILVTLAQISGAQSARCARKFNFCYHAIIEQYAVRSLQMTANVNFPNLWHTNAIV